jgi:hypothetical protein
MTGAVTLLIPPLPLPRSLPHSSAIASTGSSAEHYTPEWWESEYRARRYLGRVSQPVLESRYKSILQNLATLVSEERDIIPLTSALSSWYWFRKEHQTRLEFSLRQASVAVPELPLYSVRIGPAKPEYPNAGNVLFRYGQKVHLQQMLNDGVVRLGSATSYVQIENDAARQDDEVTKISYLPGEYARVATLAGREIPILGDITRKTSTSNYYLLCLSSRWDRQLLTVFKGTDGCLLIRDVEQLHKRLARVCENMFPGCISSLLPVHYFDPYDLRAREPSMPILLKDFRFAYQQEWRFICVPRKGEPAQKAIFLNAEPLTDIAELFDSRWEPRQ